MEKNNLPEFVDVHAHVQFNAYEEDRDEVIKRSLENKTWMINVGTNLKTSKDAVALTEKYPEGVFAIVGLHPIHTSVSFHDKEEIGEESEPFNSKGEEFNVEEFEKLISKYRSVTVEAKTYQNGRGGNRNLYSSCYKSNRAVSNR